MNYSDAAKSTDAETPGLAANASGLNRGEPDDAEIMGPEDIDEGVDDPLISLWNKHMKADYSELKGESRISTGMKTFVYRLSASDVMLCFDVREMHDKGETTWSIAELHKWVSERLEGRVSYTQFRRFVNKEPPYNDEKYTRESYERTVRAKANAKSRTGISKAKSSGKRSKATTRSRN